MALAMVGPTAGWIFEDGSLIGLEEVEPTVSLCLEVRTTAGLLVFEGGAHGKVKLCKWDPCPSRVLQVGPNRCFAWGTPGGAFFL